MKATVLVCFLVLILSSCEWANHEDEMAPGEILATMECKNYTYMVYVVNGKIEPMYPVGEIWECKPKEQITKE